MKYLIAFIAGVIIQTAFSFGFSLAHKPESIPVQLHNQTYDSGAPTMGGADMVIGKELMRALAVCHTYDGVVSLRLWDFESRLTCEVAEGKWAGSYEHHNSEWRSEVKTFLK